LRALREGQSFELNLATQRDLQLLPGVGPKLAERILIERQRRGGFERVSDLLEVKGIGPATLERLSRFVRVEPRSTDRTAAPR
jgi:competence protein ComEA